MFSIAQLWYPCDSLKRLVLSGDRYNHARTPESIALKFNFNLDSDLDARCV